VEESVKLVDCARSVEEWVRGTEIASGDKACKFVAEGECAKSVGAEVVELELKFKFPDNVEVTAAKAADRVPITDARAFLAASSSVNLFG
jgi:hypothetical protein